MAKLNKPKESIHTREGAVAHRGNALHQLKRSVMTCMLWENEFYEDGEEIAARIVRLTGEAPPDEVAVVALRARNQMHLRHVPLLIAMGLVKHGHGSQARDVLDQCIQRADELSEALAVFAKVNGRELNKLKPLPAAVKKGIATAFGKFDEYQLAKYDRSGAVRLRDALFLAHPKPVNEDQAALWKRLAEGKLATPSTWEVGLSAGKGAKTDAEKKERWTNLLSEGKLGAMALLRNLRNMTEASVDLKLVQLALAQADVTRVLPFRFISAARHAVHLEPEIEAALMRKMATGDKWQGRTAVIVDCSGSMQGQVSGRSEITLSDAACGVAMLVREMCEDVRVYAFGAEVEEVPARHGFALRDAVQRARVGHSTYIGKAVRKAKKEKPDRIIVLTDGQSHDTVPQPGCKGYMINLASNQHGVDHGVWHGISGWSEAVLDYITEVEQDEMA